MPSHCPHCRSSTDQGSDAPTSGTCPACGASFGPPPSDPGIALEDGMPACPASFGPYRVLGLIGKGGMGVVYHARHESTGLEVAIKTVRLRKQDLLRRIRREVHALARLRHPGLVRIIETGEVDGLPWYAMELLRGPTLHELLRLRPPGLRRARADPSETRADFVLAWEAVESPSRPSIGSTATRGDVEPRTPYEGTRILENRGEIRPGIDDFASDTPSPDDEEGPIGPEESPVPEVAEFDAIPEARRRAFLVLIARLCRSLAYLHGEGIVHRDLKPQNVMIRPDGTPVLLDFGLASYFGAGGRESLEVAGLVEGTPEYMSPEQIRGELLDARSDLYAVGCMLFEGLTGRVPFRGRTPSETLRAHREDPPPSPRSIRPDVPEDLERVILRLLAKSAGERLGYARDVEEALDRAGAGAGDWASDLAPRDYLYRPEFVGRLAVLDELEREVRRVLARPGHCVFLRGGSGAGKTRVILELARRLNASGLRVLTGECLPIGVEVAGDDGPGVRATPLHPFRPFLQAVADACLELGPAEVERILGPRARDLAECEPALARLAVARGDDPGPPPEPIDNGRRARLIEALGETLAEVGRRSPVVVLLDDLQWADAPTRQFLALYHFGAWDLPGVAIVAAYPAEEEDDAMKGYRPAFHDATFIDIGPLGEGSVAEIVRGMLGSGTADERLVGHLSRRSGGNPFFVAEALRAAVAEGLLRRDPDGTWRARDARGNPADPEALDAAIPLPCSIQALVARRIEALPPDARALLELAAVAGREVDAGLLESLDPIGEARSLAAVESLLVAQVVEEGRDGRSYRFAHDKLREVAYEQIPPPRRRELHRAVARAIEAAHTDDLARHLADLAHHWYRSLGDRSADAPGVARAIEFLEKAAVQAVNGGLPAEAVHFGRVAARLLGVDLPEGPAEVAEAMAAELAEIDRALNGRAPGDLIVLPGASDADADRAIGLLLTIHPPAFLSNQFTLFALMASRCLRLTLERGNGPLAPAVYAMYAIVTRILRDDAATAHAFGRLAIDLDRRRGGAMAADVLFLNAWFLNHWVAPMAASLPDCDLGAEAGLASGGILYGCYNHATYVVLLAASGAPLPRVVEAAEARLARIGERVLVARFHCILERQFARALAGRTDGPTSLTDDAFDEARDLAFIVRTTNYNQVGYYHAARLKLHYLRGEYRQALEAANLARTVWDSIVRQIAEVEIVFYRALALVAAVNPPGGPIRPARLAEAREHLATLARWRAGSEANFGHKALLVEAEIARSEGRDAEAFRLFDEAGRSADRHGFLPQAALARELAGRHQQRLGHADAARALLVEAAATYRAWGAVSLADALVLFA